MNQPNPVTSEWVRNTVVDAVNSAKIIDVHTHLCGTQFGSLLLWGIDDLLTYHYLVAETFRWIDMPYERFWAMSKREQADLIWRTLFLDHSPYSEACRGVLTVLERLGLDVASRDLESYRSWFAEQTIDGYIDKVFGLSGVESVVMTNDPFDELERPVWLAGGNSDPRFKAALRVDVLLNSWEKACGALSEWGYAVSLDMTGETFSEVRRFLGEWVDRIDALYMAVSLPSDFTMPEGSPRGRLISECVLPVCREKGIPFALMIGVKRQVNPQLRLAGDGVGKARIEAVEHLCAEYPENRLLVTMLSRENQHELCVTARKFRNLMVFGCWWFLNNPSLIDEITRMRFELLGASVIPQHSDARVLDQLVYKWAHSRRIIADILVDKYEDLAATGWVPSECEIRRDVDDLFGGTFTEFLGR